MKIKTISIVAFTLTAGLAVSGCSANAENPTAGNNESSLKSSVLSAADAERLATSPKVPGYIIAPTLENSFAKGSMFINVLGRISHIHSPRTTCMAEGAACFEYIPVEVDVLGSLPGLGESKIVLRSWPTAEYAEDPRLLKVGDIVIANPVEKTTDDAGLEAYSLGNIFKVDSAGVIRDYSEEADALGTLSDVDRMLGTQFENKFLALK